MWHCKGSISRSDILHPFDRAAPYITLSRLFSLITSPYCGPPEPTVFFNWSFSPWSLSTTRLMAAITRSRSSTLWPPIPVPRLFWRDESIASVRELPKLGRNKTTLWLNKQKITDLLPALQLQWANIKKWGWRSGGRFHTNQWILFTHALGWCLCLQEYRKRSILHLRTGGKNGLS